LITQKLFSDPKQYTQSSVCTATNNGDLRKNLNRLMNKNNKRLKKLLDERDDPRRVREAMEIIEQEIPTHQESEIKKEIASQMESEIAQSIESKLFSYHGLKEEVSKLDWEASP